MGKTKLKKKIHEGRHQYGKSVPLDEQLAESDGVRSVPRQKQSKEEDTYDNVRFIL